MEYLFGGYLQPMNVLGTFGTTNNAVTSLNDYWYSVSDFVIVIQLVF